jgi:hypothetical protein
VAAKRVNGAHDLGGMHGFGPVPYESNEPVFHEDWERRVFAMSWALDATVDEFRHAIERMGNDRYLSSSYYEHWLAAMETLFLEKGTITEEEYLERLDAVREAPAEFEPSRARRRTSCRDSPRTGSAKAAVRVATSRRSRDSASAIRCGRR